MAYQAMLIFNTTAARFIRVMRDGPRHHITLVSPHELNSLAAEGGLQPSDVLALLQQQVSRGDSGCSDMGN
jgi:hypothetical protein